MRESRRGNIITLSASLTDDADFAAMMGRARTLLGVPKMHACQWLRDPCDLPDGRCPYNGSDSACGHPVKA